MVDKIIKYGDIGTPEQHTKGELCKEVVNGTLVARSLRQAIYVTLLNRKLINNTQYYAAERLATHCDIGRGRGDSQPRERVSGGSIMSEPERQLIYQDLYKRAILCLDTHERPLIISVVIDNTPPTNRAMGAKSRRQRMIRLRISLDKLAKHYHFA